MHLLILFNLSKKPVPSYSLTGIISALNAKFCRLPGISYSYAVGQNLRKKKLCSVQVLTFQNPPFKRFGLSLLKKKKICAQYSAARKRCWQCLTPCTRHSPLSTRYPSLPAGECPAGFPSLLSLYSPTVMYSGPCYSGGVLNSMF